MARSLLLSASLLLAVMVRAQIWCAPGATWTYTFFTFTAQGFSQFTYEGDTVIDGTTSQQIEWRMAFHDYVNATDVDQLYETIYTSIDGDLVSVWNGIAFDTLYNFGAAPGDHWELSQQGGGGTGQFVSVVDTGTQMVDGVPLHYLVTGQAWPPADTVYERVGGLYLFIVPWWAAVLDGFGGPLRCYTDSTISYHSPWWDYGCESWVGANEEIATEQLKPYPNPGTDHLMLTLSKAVQDASLLLFDATGREVLRTVMSSDHASVTTTALAQGLFNYRLIDLDGILLSQGNWMKQ